ncbi:hypothetical protein [Clostridium frigidicarnis]|uniref:Uncharacterized protein n=1 Tax=Clostridium frigidicarnis TaxID=84698 RepID=A0A1I0Y509_9CLOT|nr:hypothetical protein [Clostridium frigidicarnis]SFB08389.1 hypothetical protein SAMN04488528_101143 [Clostridium frigidicarnis]
MVRIIKILSEDSSIIYDGELYKLPISESIIVEKSIEYFCDSEPCFIHKSAVTKRLYYEFDRFFDEKLDNNIKIIEFKEFPLVLQNIISKLGNARKILLQ